MGSVLLFWFSNFVGKRINNIIAGRLLAHASVNASAKQGRGH